MSGGVHMERLLLIQLCSGCAHLTWSFGVCAEEMVVKNWRLSTLDPRAVNHMLTQSDIYQKPEDLRTLLGAVAGPGMSSDGTYLYFASHPLRTPCLGRSVE